MIEKSKRPRIQKFFSPEIYLLLSLVLTMATNDSKLPSHLLVLPGIFLISISALLVKLARYSELEDPASLNFRVPTKLMDFNRGPYGWMRNPKYIGLLGILLGFILIIGTASGFFFLFLYASLIHFVFVKREERLLTETFGIIYVNYCKAVKRYGIF